MTDSGDAFTFELREAARALGIGTDLAYRSARNGSFPVPIIRCGARWLVPTPALAKALCIDLPPGELVTAHRLRCALGTGSTDEAASEDISSPRFEN